MNICVQVIGLIVALTLTNIDLKLFLEQYDVSDLTYESGWKFKAIQGLFTKYIDKWIAEKNEGTITGNKGQRTRAKLMLNRTLSVNLQNQ